MEKRSGCGGERAASPVIGVILMVAITVILGAVIGTFVLDVGGDVNTTGQAGVSFEQEGGTNTVDITLLNLGNLNEPNKVFIRGNCTSDTAFSELGQTISVSGCNDGEKIHAMATKDGGDTVIASYEVK